MVPTLDSGGVRDVGCVLLFFVFGRGGGGGGTRGVQSFLALWTLSGWVGFSGERLLAFVILFGRG